MFLEVSVAIFLVYCSLSYVLLRWPTLLHKPKSTSINATFIGHRGGSGEFIENTLHAFDCCVKMGCDMLEMDCQLTKDEQVVVSHDDNLSRSCGVDKCISDLNYSELPEYLNCLSVTFGFVDETLGSTARRECCAEAGVSRAIPLLSSVFERFPRVPINIDVKRDNDVMIKKISELVKLYNRADITVWGSFSDTVNRKCQAADPSLSTFVPVKRTLKIALAYYLGLLPFLPISDAFFEVPLVHNFGRMPNVIDFIKEMTAGIPKFLRFGLSDDDLVRVTLRVADLLLMSRKLVDHLRARGIQVFYWVCNTDEDFDRAFAMGKVAVVTDYPSELVAYLRRHPEIPRGTFSKSI